MYNINIQIYCHIDGEESGKRGSEILDFFVQQTCRNTLFHFPTNRQKYVAIHFSQKTGFFSFHKRKRADWKKPVDRKIVCCCCYLILLATAEVFNSSCCLFAEASIFKEMAFMKIERWWSYPDIMKSSMVFMHWKCLVLSWFGWVLKRKCHWSGWKKHTFIASVMIAVIFYATWVEFCYDTVINLISK